MTTNEPCQSPRPRQRRWRLPVTVAVLTALLLILAPRLFDGDAIRAQVTDAASTALGHPVSIDGGIAVRLLPRPALVIERLTVRNPDWPGEATLMSAERMVAAPALLDLILGRISLTRFDAHGVEVWLEREPSGQLNWTSTASTDPAAADPAGGSVLPGLDAFAARRVTLHVRNGDGDGDAVTLDQVTIEGSIVEGTVSARLETHIKGLAALVPALANLTGDAGDIKAHAELEFDPAGDLRVTEVTIGEGAAAATGAIAVGWREPTPTIDGQIRIDSLTVPGHCADEERPLTPVLPGASAPLPADAQRLLPGWRGKVDVEVGEFLFASLRLRDAKLAATGVDDSTTVVLSTARDRIELVLAEAAEHDPEWRVEARLGATNVVGGLTCAGVPASLVEGISAIAITAHSRGRTRAAVFDQLEGRLQVDGEIVANAAGWRLGNADASIREGRLDAITVQVRPADGAATTLTGSGGPLRGLLRDGWPFEARWDGGTRTLQVDGTLERGDSGFSAAGRFSGAVQPDSENATAGVTGSGRWRITRETATLSELAVAISESRMTGSLRLDMSTSRPTLSGDLVFPQFDIDVLAALPALEAGSVSSSPGLLLDSVRVRVTKLGGLPLPLANVDARVHHDGKRLRLDALALDIASAPLQGALDVHTAASPPVATLDLAGAKVALEPFLQAWLPGAAPGTIDGLRLRGRASGESFGELAASLEIDVSARRAIVEALPGGIGPMRLDSLDLRVRPGTSIEGTTSATVGGESLELALSADLDKGGWNVTANGAVGHVRLEGSNAFAPAGGNAALSVSAKGEDTTRLLALLDIAATRPGAAWRFDMQFAHEGDVVVARALTASVTGIGEVRGDVHLVNANGKRPRLEGKLESQRLDLSALLADTRTGDSSTSLRPREWPLPMPPDLPFDVQLALSAQEVVAAQTRLRGVRARLVSEPARLTLDNARLGMDGGASVSGRAEVSKGESAPRLALSLDASALNLGTLIPEEHTRAPLAWLADASIELAGEGHDLGEVLAAGNGGLRVTGGPTVERMEDLSALEINILALMLPQLGKTGRSRLNCAVLDASLDDGQLATRALLLDAETVTIAGAGNIDLKADTIDLLLAARPKKRNLLGSATPVRVSGPLFDPQVSVATVGFVSSTTSLVLGTVNPYLLLGSFVTAKVISATGTEPCTRALDEAANPDEAAQEEATGLEEAQSGSLGDLLRAPFRALGRGLDNDTSGNADR